MDNETQLLNFIKQATAKLETEKLISNEIGSDELSKPRRMSKPSEMTTNLESAKTLKTSDEILEKLEDQMSKIEKYNFSNGCRKWNWVRVILAIRQAWGRKLILVDIDGDGLTELSKKLSADSETFEVDLSKDISKNENFVQKLNSLEIDIVIANAGLRG